MKDDRKLLAISLIITLLLSCTNNDGAKDNNMNTQPANEKELASNSKLKLEVKTYQNNSSTKGWGYDVYNDGRLYLHQPTIPAVPGIREFQSEQFARTAGNFAVYKIRNGVMPPTISVQELDSLGVLNN